MGLGAGKITDGVNLIRVNTPKEIDAVRRLFREYEAYLKVDLCFQDFELELATLPGKYAPPSGTLLLALDGEKPVGCGGLRRHGRAQNRTCEMKRLYVRPETRGLGLGKQLAIRLVQEAVRLGYSSIVLDTLGRLESAIHIYKSLGFVPTKPYYDNPLPDVRYWKLDLICNPDF